MYRKTVCMMFLVSLIVGMVSQGFLVLDVHAADTIIDTHGDGRFTRYPSGPYWWSVADHDVFRTRAYNNNFWYTQCGDAAHGDPYYGLWQASLSQSGSYEVFAWIPNPDAFDAYAPTQSAQYQIYHRDGMTIRTVNQRLRTGSFYSLGTFNFDTSASVILNDRTGESYLSTMIAFDAIKFVAIEPPPCNVHLESRQDNSATTNLGTTTFDGVSYGLPNDVSKVAGTYQATYYPTSNYIFTSWETSSGISVSSTGSNPTSAIVSGSGTLRAIYKNAPPPTYTAAIDAYCNTESVNVGVPITMDGASTGYNTPHTFAGLSGSHTFTVPSSDGNGHPFKQWSTGQTTTTITVSSDATYWAYYEASISIYDATIVAHCNTDGVDIGVAITKDGSSTGYNTPHTFTGLTSSHTFAVPSADASGHPFINWNTGQTTTSITVSSAGTYTAYYQATPPTPRTLTVYSVYGNPVPGKGQHTYNDLSSVTCSISSPVVEGGVSYSCTGWSGTGSVPSSGTSTSTGSFIITQDSTITWNWIVTPADQPPNCVVKLQKKGSETNEIDVGEFFDIYVGDSTDDKGITEVRFSSDDSWDGIPSGQWTQWYSLTASSGDWDASTKTKHWTLTTPGIKEVWAEVTDTGGNADKDHKAIQAKEWTFGIVADLHIGRGWYDFGAPGYDDSGGDTLTNCLTDRLIDTVTWINANHETENIKFLVALGDITDSGERSEFLRARGILDNLQIPYFPVIGNHDVWSKAGGDTQGVVKGDRYFSEIFDATFFTTQFNSLGVDWGEKQPISSQYLQNYAFGYRGVNFIFVDYVERSWSGAGGVCAYPFQDTMNWIEEMMRDHSETSVATFSHYPFTTTGAGPYAGTLKGSLGRIAITYNREVLVFGGHVHFGDNRNFQTLESAYFRQSGTEFKYYDTWYYGATKTTVSSIVTKGMMGGFRYDQPDTSKDFLRIVTGTRVDQSKLQKLDNAPDIPDSNDPDSKILDLPWYQQIQLPMRILTSIFKKSPGELRVYDSEGHVTGLVGGIVKNEIPNSSYSEDCVIILSAFDSYEYEVVGTEDGSYGIETTFVNASDVSKFVAMDILSNTGGIHRYSTNWTMLSQGGNGVTVSVDANGDGLFEHIFVSDGELAANEFLGVFADINSDGIVDIYDAILLANAYNSVPTSSHWNPNSDINSDNIVDIYDAIILANHYNQHYP